MRIVRFRSTWRPEWRPWISRPSAVGSTQLASGLTLAGTTTGAFSGNLTGNATTAESDANFTDPLAGDMTGPQGTTAIAATTVTGKALTGFASGAGAVTASDSLLTAVNKLNGNVSLKAPPRSPRRPSRAL